MHVAGEQLMPMVAIATIMLQGMVVQVITAMTMVAHIMIILAMATAILVACKDMGTNRGQAAVSFRDINRIENGHSGLLLMSVFALYMFLTLHII
jgi:uncharacterized membrane protein YfbV (UPF0208 family)